MRAARAAAEERNRIARELHDVIAHCVRVMVVQTSAARLIVGSDVDAAQEALAVVESAGRDALVEFRRIVGVLRRDSDELAGPPTPGSRNSAYWRLAPPLLGCRSPLSVSGWPEALSASLDLVAYRLVQEAVTNAIKHAGSARSEVRVRVDADELELVVRDTGRGPPRRLVGGWFRTRTGRDERTGRAVRWRVASRGACRGRI